jgi:hypothetical protein
LKKVNLVTETRGVNWKIPEEELIRSGLKDERTP